MKSLKVSLLILLFVFSFFIKQGLTQDVSSINSGDTAWVLISSALVMLMTLPGLALFYGGLSKRKDTLNTIAMSFITYCLVSILWIVYGYTLSFGADVAGLIGNFSKLFLKGINLNSLSGTIPEFIFVMFQLTFAAITVALISGAYIERLKFSVWICFSILWFTFSYIPVAHWVWGGGFLSKLGALDFAGGTVVHINAGIAALVGAMILKSRYDKAVIPHNLTLVVLGAGLLWFGWFGFNAGSALAANSLASAAFLNTNTATAMAALAWCFTEWLIFKKPTILGLASGVVVVGLVAITPAAGFVNIKGAIIIGLIAGILCFISVAYVKPKLGYDDTLDVFGIHGVGGFIGAILTGIFADPSIGGTAGLLYGNPKQLWIQIIAAGTTVVYTAIVTAIIFGILKIIFGNLRVPAGDELVGLDETQHGEKAYNLHI
ncbi:MAG: Ammonia channel protein AmtB [Thermodesulfobacterium sp.]|uniref:Ammonium transporter n=1 Tax=Candidatus Thermodesulfobacterium syntrophicum TaxID=3060442 RepID=A0AAE3TEG5_9BACT|nr:Ammonia channel protein AmtB [Candidatus Thermodesulfobacterium syntrophicum]